MGETSFLLRNRANFLEHSDSLQVAQNIQEGRRLLPILEQPHLFLPTRERLIKSPELLFSGQKMNVEKSTTIFLEFPRVFLITFAMVKGVLGGLI